MPLQPQKTSDLLRNGEYERAWQRHCGFLDLSLDEFMQIQRRRLEEQISIARASRLWQTVFGPTVHDLSVATFRDVMPLTTYQQYEAVLKERSDDVLALPAVSWARTSGRGGSPKWVPYTAAAQEQLGVAALAGDFLSTARHRGDIRIRPNDVLVYNTPPRPYLSGLTMVALAAVFDFRFIPSLDETESLDFVARNEQIFRQAMAEGMDILGSMPVVAVRMGERFSQGTPRSESFSWRQLDPRIIWRYARARTRARREGRTNILPRDLWQPKGLLCGGTDTAAYREQIRAYWGVEPYELYGCTEAGIIAVQAWNYQALTLLPGAAFYEFIPYSAWQEERLTGVMPSTTLLLDQLEVGERYELVVSNFDGGPFARYRLRDLIEVVALRDDELGIDLPQIRLVGRSGDFIDLSGFAGLLDEPQLSAALAQSTKGVVDWAVRKEIDGHLARLHFYIEPASNNDQSTDEIGARIHAALAGLNPDYATIEPLLGYVPLDVTFVSEGSFQRFVQHQLREGADLAHMKPARIQPTDEALHLLQRI